MKEFKFKTDLNCLPEHMSWDEYSFKKGKMSFIAQDFDSRKIIAILDGRTQATIRNQFLRYSRQVRNSVKIITMDMFSPTTTSPETLPFCENCPRPLSHCTTSRPGYEPSSHPNHESVG
ncbi:transposase [Streptococcus massiliensis]|uniref:transposase n=1 Tax=Streptococcus massiliensis TaxID=313439 RepID=UPI003CC821A2